MTVAAEQLLALLCEIDAGHIEAEPCQRGYLRRALDVLAA
jgi:hypothetical protein